MKAVFKKELKSYFSGILGYIFMAGMLLILGIFLWMYCLNYQYAQFEYAYGGSVFAFLVIIPLITMRLFAEERKQKTDKLLYSLPLKMSGIVAGKYFAALCILAIPCIISLAYAPIIGLFGEINPKTILFSALYFFLLGAAFISICMFISALTENQIVAAVISFVVLFINYILANLTGALSSSMAASVFALIAVSLIAALLAGIVTKNKVLAELVGIVLIAAIMVIYFVKSELISGIAPKVLNKLTLFDMFYDVVDGSAAVSVVVMYLSVSFLFCFLTAQVLERRRWA